MELIQAEPFVLQQSIMSGLIGKVSIEGLSIMELNHPSRWRSAYAEITFGAGDGMMDHALPMLLPRIAHLSKQCI